MKPLTKEQFETITKWLANDPDVSEMAYGQFLKDFGNTQEDQEPKATELWQWQLCPKCHGEKKVPYAPLGGIVAGELNRKCPFCLGEGGLKIPQGVFNFKIGPVDNPETFKDMLEEFKKNQSGMAQQPESPNAIESFFTDEKKTELFTATGLAINKAYKNGEYPLSDLEEYWYYIGAGDMRAIIWDTLKQMAK